MNLSGTELRDRLQSGAEIPEWFSFPSVIEELRKSYPAMQERGFNVFIAGDGSSDNSSLGNAVAEMLLEEGSRPVTVLDDPGLSDSTINLVAREVSRNGGAVISVPDGSDGSETAQSFGLGEGMFVWVQRGDGVDGADVSIDSQKTPGEGARAVMDHLKALGLVS